MVTKHAETGFSSPGPGKAGSGFDITRLKELRTKAGLTQRALAARAGVSHITICLYEGGKVPRPRASVVARIETALSTRFQEELPPGRPMKNCPPEVYRTVCPHCGTSNCHMLEVPIPGIEFQCISCARVFRIGQKGQAYIPEPPKTPKIHDAWHRDGEGRRV